MSHPSAVLSARGLYKRFGAKVAVAGVDLQVEPGEIVGFLGPNGAGKTTVMTLIAGLSRPDAGDLSLFGVPSGAAQPALRSRIGFLQEKPRIYPEMSGRAYLRLFASLFAIEKPAERVEELITTMSLGHAAERALSTYSRGMQQRTCLARALLHRPDFLVLDEPTLGLDPVGVAEMRDMILALHREGVAILFSSHQLAEMERICDRVILMNAGKVVATGTKDDLVRQLVGAREVDAELDVMTPQVLAALEALPVVALAKQISERVVRLSIRDSDTTDDLALRGVIARCVAGAGGLPLQVALRTATLEDAFLRLARPALH